MLKCFAYVLKLISSLAATLFMGVVFLLYFPHWSCWFTLLFILIAVPIEKIQNFWKKLHIKGALKVIILILLFILALMNSPSGEYEANKPEPTEAITASAEPTITETTEAAITETSVSETTEAETTTETTLPEITEAPTIPETTMLTEPPTEETIAETLGPDEITMLVDIMVGSGFENYEVTRDEDLINVNVWVDGLSYLATFASAGDSESKKQWEDGVDMQVYSHEELTKFIRESDQPHMFISFNILNEQDKSKVLLSTLNGVVMYDCVNGINLLG